MEKIRDNKLLKLLMVIVSAIIQAIAMTSFSVPGQIYPSGITGICRLLSDILKDYASVNISYSVFYFPINLLLAFITFKYIGKWFTIFSIIQIFVMSIMSMLFKPLIVLNDRILIALFGGVINGIACGLALSNNASTGGMDFLTIYFSNKYKKSVWNYIFALNCVLLFTAGIIYNWETSAYSLIFQYCSTTIIKSMHKRYTHQTITIITKKPDEVSEQILADVRHGITAINATGMYKKEDVKILYTVVNSFQTQEVINATLKADPNAFMNVQETQEVRGNYYQKPLD